MKIKNGTKPRTRRKSLRWLLLLMAGVVVSVGATSLEAQLAPETALVQTLSGRVSVERAGELWVLMPGQTVKGGQVVVTGPDGYAKMELSDQSTIEVFPNSRLVFRANRFNWSDLVDLYLGKIRLHIQRLVNDEETYRVTSPTAVISVRGTILEVEVDAAEDTWVYVETGSVLVRHRLMPGGDVLVESGQSLRINQNVPLTAAKLTTPLAVIGRIVRIAGETIARVDGLSGGKSKGGSGSPSGSSGGSTTGAGSGTSGGDAGSNEPAPAPGEDDTSASP
jgi:ferric-dicitrate binding protein FerR (iron transport regulator)